MVPTIAMDSPALLLTLFLGILLTTLLTSLLQHLKSKSAPQPEPPLYPTVLSTSTSPTHTFTKPPTSPSTGITLLAGLGVANDAHLGVTVQHRSRLHIQPPPPNLRQVHLLATEVLAAHGVEPGELGENVTTVGIDLLGLGRGDKVRFVSGRETKERGEEEEEEEEAAAPCVTIQGLRNPCPQIEKFQAGLQEKYIVRDSERKIVARKAGVMGTVDVGGEVRAGMRIVVERAEPFVKLECV